LRGVDLVFLGDCLDSFDSLERLKSYPGFEFWFVSAASGVHFGGAFVGFISILTAFRLA
jgi:hypothetical protein